MIEAVEQERIPRGPLPQRVVVAQGSGSIKQKSQQLKSLAAAPSNTTTSTTKEGRQIPQRTSPQSFAAPSSSSTPGPSAATTSDISSMDHEYETLDSDSPMYANLLAGAFAGVMVSY